jgi:Flp pilus assembly protein TadG
MKTRRKRGGNSMIEAGLALPLVFLLLIGVADFGRVFYTAVKVTNAAYAGALAGSRVVANATNTALIRNAALNDAPEVTGMGVTSERTCRCANGEAVACSGSCASGGNVRTYLAVTTQKTFRTLAPYPKVPREVPITATTVVRVQ